MSSQLLTQMQQSSYSRALPGTWKLAAGRAITLEPAEAGVLRVARGQVWATFDGPHGGPPNDLGDHVLRTGEQLELGVGQRLVLEAWDARAPAYFSWDPIAIRELDAAPRLAAVVSPLADLRTAWALGAGAAARLVAALASAAWDLLGGRRRGKLGDCARIARHGACGAHGV